MDKKDQWCFAWFASGPTGPGADRAALAKGAKWRQGDSITVSFLDGDPALQAKVKRVAQQWTAPRLAKLTLEFRNDTNKTNIRISFRYRGSWSSIGTTCRQVTDMTQPTMNYGWLNENSTDEEVERVVLHEFGHALGLIHEHQNPGGQIQWNREQVIQDLSGPPNNWSLETIEFNMFQPFARNETNYTGLDSHSIMMYPIPSKWTKDGFSAGLNSKLSDTDKEFIREQYP
jgi:serralysin